MFPLEFRDRDSYRIPSYSERKNYFDRNPESKSAMLMDIPSEDLFPGLRFLFRKINVVLTALSL